MAIPSLKAILSIALILFLGGFLGCSAFEGYFSGDPEESSENLPMYLGVEEVAPEALVALIPSIKDQYTVLQFTSELCLDCQRMAPILKKIRIHYPQVAFLTLEVNQSTPETQPILDAFQPSITPTLMFIQPGGSVVRVLYGFQKEAVTQKAFDQLLGTAEVKVDSSPAQNASDSSKP